MMNRPRVLLVALALFGIATWLVACNEKSSPTSPAGGGELAGNLSSIGMQYAHTFATAGTYNYKCAVHPTCGSLTGTIVVIAVGGIIANRVLGIAQSGGTTGPYGSTCASLSLQRDTVFVGDVVTWINNSPLPHTVTSQ